jgi:NTE family protein
MPEPASPDPARRRQPAQGPLGAPGPGRTRARGIALVLGAGGMPGYAFHTGALAALATTGWDPRRAELIVGTSAGSAAGSMLRAGLSATDHFAHTTGGPVSAEGRALLDRLPRAAWDSGELAAAAPPWPASLPLAVRGLLGWPPRPGLTVAGVLPRGRRSTAPMGDRHRAAHTGWPDATLWICAVRMADGHRAVFGRDDLPPVDVGTAVEASSAVPGVFRPVQAGGQRYVDGGVWSMTNADLTTGLGFDAVVVVAPLSGATGWRDLSRQAGRLTVDGAHRAYHRSVLEAELRRVRHTGTPVIAIEPSAEDEVVLTANPGDPARPGGRDTRRADIAQRAYESVCQRLAQEPVLTRLLTEPVPA